VRRPERHTLLRLLACSAMDSMRKTPLCSRQRGDYMCGLREAGTRPPPPYRRRPERQRQCCLSRSGAACGAPDAHGALQANPIRRERCYSRSGRPPSRSADTPKRNPIEKASGQKYAKYLDAQFFKPLGLKQTSYCPSKTSDSAFALGYSRGPNGTSCRSLVTCAPCHGNRVERFVTQCCGI
jgi:hypothetical protein